MIHSQSQSIMNRNKPNVKNVCLEGIRSNKSFIFFHSALHEVEYLEKKKKIELNQKNK